MVKTVWFNGAYVTENELNVSAFDRAWRFADGGFETIFFNGHEAPLYPYHASRASQHAQAIGIWMQLPFVDAFREILKQLAKKNNIPHQARCRITWFRGEGGYYLPQNNEGQVLIELSPFDLSQVKREIKAILYNDQALVAGKLSPYKKLGAHVYIDAARFAQLMEADEAILLNGEGNVAEASASNLLYRKGSSFFAPRIQDGGVEGIMLHFLSKYLPEQGYSFQRISFGPNELLQADEILSVNALRGICCITSLFGKTFSSTSLALNEQLPIK